MKKWIFISALALSAIVCNLGAPAPTPSTAPNEGAMATLIAMASATAEAQTTPTPGTPAGSSLHEMGTVSGKLSYPADSIPSMRVVAFDISTGEVRYIDTVAGQSTYSLALPVGTYHIVAYSLPAGIAGGYTRAILCGLAVECADHALIDVIVTSGVSITDVNPGDFYAGENVFPPMPGE